MTRVKLLNLVFITFALIGFKPSFAQLDSSNLFLKGAYLEIGSQPNGTLGSGVTVPSSSYHPHLGGTTSAYICSLSSPRFLGAVYDYGHDGWTTGAPPFMGDYTLMGSPMEFWSLKTSTFFGAANATTCNYTGSMSGGFTSYSNIGGSAHGTWVGTADSGRIGITKDYRIDTFGSALVVTVKLVNNTSSTISDVYYMRGVDPDANVSWAGGTYTTSNVVDYQNDALHRSMARATCIGGDSATGRPAASMCIGAKDCRARVSVYTNWYTPARAIDSIWNGYSFAAIGTNYATAGSTVSGDYAIGVSFKLGSLAPYDSVFFAYAYIFDGNDSASAVDGAFPNPVMQIAHIDTFHGSHTVYPCDYAYASTVNAYVEHGDNGIWAGSTWSWAPSTALSSTSGVNVNIDRGSLSSPVTYTITGVDTAYAGCTGGIQTYYLTVYPIPHVGVISGASTVCRGASITLSDTSAGGTWSCSNTTVATVTGLGVVYGISTGIDTVYYTKTDSCGSYSTYKVITVTGSASAGTITGPDRICVGATGTFSDTVSGGTWSIAHPSMATVSSSGVVTAISAGVDTIRYTVTTCGTVTVSRAFTIMPLPTVSAISGPTSLCMGTGTITLIDTTSGGVWSSLSPTIATVSATGVVTGVSSGIVTIRYSVTNSCGTTNVDYTITIATAPSAPASITGPTSVCQGATITLADATTGGVWSSSNASVATVNSSTGVVTGVAAGTVTITYSISNACGSTYATYSVTVNPLPATPSAITGISSVCAGATGTLSDATVGGVWSSSNTSIATVSASGVVTGVAAGSVTITYTVSNSCGSRYVTKAITVNSTSSVSAISGPTSVCTGATITLSDATPGGVWSSSATSVATISTSGVVTGLTTGVVTISYTVTGTCGSAVATYTVNVNTVPSVNAISGSSTMCVGTSAAFTDATVGGIWSSTNTSVATVGAGGMVTAVAIGSTTISYTVTNSCGAAAATKAVTVSAIPTAGTISGATSVCAGLNTTLTSTVTGGVWSSGTTAVATVSTGGVVTGMAAGSTTITYTVTTSCGSATSTWGMTVNPAPNAGIISGSTTVCVGATTPYTSTVTGGTWSSAAPTIASVTTAGIVRGLVAGTSVISYVVTNTCGSNTATKTITVNPAPAAGTISGPTTVCTGSSITLTDATSGGVWTSSNTAIATISAIGVVTGVAAGSASISYTVSNSCGTATAGYVITVSASPTVKPIVGSTAVCIGSTTTLTDSTTGGTWSSSNTALATVTTGGVVRGVAAGTVTISYTVTTACATVTVTKTLTVSASSTAGSISGLSSVCVGATITLTSSGTAGGSWSSSNTSVATVTSGGVVRGVAAGTINITYSVTSACGTVSAYKTIIVSAAPTVSSITGSSSICTGTSSTYTDASTGGGWISSNTAIATVNSSGVLTGISAGTITLTYFITNSCGTATTTKSVTVSSLSAGVISGASSLSRGASTTYTNTVTGGTWSSSNTALATIVSTSGLATGVAAGIDTIKYSVTNVCGTAVARKVVTITAAKPGGNGTTTTSESGIEVYPNPSTGIINIKLPCENCTAVTVVTDITGRIIVAQTSEQQLMQMDISQYPSGMYFVQVNIDGELYTAKVQLK